MKKALLIAAVAMMSASAHASKARKAALGASGNIAMPATNLATDGVSQIGATTVATDMQDVFDNPAKMFDFGDALTIEYGTALTGTEGGVFRSAGDMKYGVYFGHKAPLMNVVAAALTAGGGTGTMTEQNPVEVFFGMKGGSVTWAASLIYSDFKDNNATGTAGSKVTNEGLRLGATADNWKAYIQSGIANSAELANGTKAKVDSGIRVGGEYMINSVDVYADYQTASGKLSAAADTKMSGSLLTIGAEEKIKGDAAHFFYGAKYLSFEQKLGDNNKATTSKLPIYAGIELDAASWLTLRGSVAQSLLVNSVKVNDLATGATTTDTSNANDMAVGFGAGIKLGKATIDGTLTAANGKFSLADNGGTGGFLTNVSMTYNF